MNKMQKTICIISAVLIMVVAIVISLLVSGDESIALPAGSVSDLKFLVSFSGDEDELINIWLNEEEGIYYAFIPSSAKNGTVSVINLGDGQSLIVDGTEYTDRNNDLRFNEDEVISAQFKNKIGGTEDFTICFKRLASIPTVFLSTESGNLDNLSISKENTEKGSACIVDSAGMTQYSGALDSVHLRGNSSFSVDKKSFVMEFPEVQSLLEMGDSKRWFLLAQHQDDTKLRVPLANAYIAEHTDLFYVDLRYADVFVNGEYYGLYLLGRNLSVENFDIENLEKSNKDYNSSARSSDPVMMKTEDDCIHAYLLNTDPGDITGGYMLEHLSEFKYQDAYPAFRTEGGERFLLRSPANASYNEVCYIKSVVDGLERALKSEDGIDPVTGKSYSDYIDVSDWVDYYLVKEGFMDVDVLSNISVFMWKDSDSNDPKIHMGPVWDMDRAFGIKIDRMYSYLSDPEYTVSSLLFSEGMLERDDVKSELRSRLESDYPDWCQNVAPGIMEELYASMCESYDADKIRWAEYGRFGYFDSETGNASMMKDFLVRRSDFLTDYYLSGSVWHSVDLLNDGQSVCKYMVRDGEKLKDLPGLHSYVAIFAGWKVISGPDRVSAGMNVKQDLVLEARWINSEWLAQNDLASIQSVIDDTDIRMLDMNELEGFRDALEAMK